MHTAPPKHHWEHHKVHWAKWPYSDGCTCRSVCGKCLPLTWHTTDITKITCRTCRRRFAYWQNRS